jgi:hypothetical protein
MSCFWEGILSRLNPEEHATMGPGPAELKRYFKLHNRQARRCMWQGELLTDELLREMQTWIEDDATPVQQGHDTSTCDPWLCLLVELLGVDVVHEYMGSTVRYTFARTNRGQAIRTLRFASNRGHFWGSR